MREYRIRIRGRVDLLVPTGKRESWQPWRPEYHDERIPQIERVVEQFSGQITSRGNFSLVSGNRKELVFDASFEPQKLVLFGIGLQSRGYEVSSNQLTEDEIRRRGELSAQARAVVMVGNPWVDIH